MLLCCDYRIAVDGPYKTGLNEVPIGMPMPRIGTLFLKSRVRPYDIAECLLFGEVTPFKKALERGYLSELLPKEDAERRAREKAAELSALRQPAFKMTKARVWEKETKEALSFLEQELNESFLPPELKG